MKKNIAHYAATVSLLALIIAAVSSPVHAQPTVNWRLDKASYVPGDSGTVTITIINTGATPLELRNLTVYYPWAGFDTNGKWLSGGNISINISPVKVLTSATSGGNNATYTTPTFNIPTWWSGGRGQQQFGCPGNAQTLRYGLYSACILLGSSDSVRYDTTDLSVTMATAVYFPSSVSILTQWVPVASLVVLIIATAILVLVLVRLGNLPKKS